MSFSRKGTAGFFLIALTGILVLALAWVLSFAVTAVTRLFG